MHGQVCMVTHMTTCVTPSVLYGTRVIIHDKPSLRGSWATHGVDGFNLSLAMQHYRCWRTYAVATEATRITDAVEWLPEPFPMPGHSPLEALTTAVQHMTGAIASVTNSDRSLLKTPSPTQQQLLAAVHSLRSLFAPTAALPPAGTPSAADERVSIPIQAPACNRQHATPPPTEQRVVATPPPICTTTIRIAEQPAQDVDSIIAEHQHIMEQQTNAPSAHYRWRPAVPAAKQRHNQQCYFHKLMNCSPTT
jgi:hypothetical protein